MRRLPATARGGTDLSPIRWFWLAAVLTATIDLLSKAIVFDALGGGPPPDLLYTDENMAWILPGAFRLICHYNTGAAWGIFKDNLFVLLGASSLLVPGLVLLAYYSQEPRAPLWGLGLVLGGAVGNLWDRLFHVGVRDFFDVINPYTGLSIWPVFNVADVAIVVGVLVYLVWSILDPIGKKRAAKNRTPTGETAS